MGLSVVSAAVAAFAVLQTVGLRRSLMDRSVGSPDLNDELLGQVGEITIPDSAQPPE